TSTDPAAEGPVADTGHREVAIRAAAPSADAPEAAERHRAGPRAVVGGSEGSTVVLMKSSRFTPPRRAIFSFLSPGRDRDATPARPALAAGAGAAPHFVLCAIERGARLQPPHRDPARRRPRPQGHHPHLGVRQ